MIAAVLVFNNTGKARLSKFYFPSSAPQRSSLLNKTYDLVSPRPDTVCNFVDVPKGFGFTSATASSQDDDMGIRLKDEELRVIYRHYATLYFVFIVDESESELGILDLIQVFVESLDRCFENVCELDLIFHFDDIHTLLNCMITGGIVLDTSLESISASFDAQRKAKKASTGSASIMDGMGIGALGGNLADQLPAFGFGGLGGLRGRITR